MLPVFLPLKLRKATGQWLASASKSKDIVKCAYDKEKESFIFSRRWPSYSHRLCCIVAASP